MDSDRLKRTTSADINTRLQKKSKTNNSPSGEEVSAVTNTHKRTHAPQATFNLIKNILNTMISFCQKNNYIKIEDKYCSNYNATKLVIALGFMCRIKELLYTKKFIEKATVWKMYENIISDAKLQKIIENILNSDETFRSEWLAFLNDPVVAEHSQQYNNTPSSLPWCMQQNATHETNSSFDKNILPDQSDESDTATITNVNIQNATHETNSSFDKNILPDQSDESDTATITNENILGTLGMFTTPTPPNIKLPHKPKPKKLSSFFWQDEKKDLIKRIINAFIDYNNTNTSNKNLFLSKKKLISALGFDNKLVNRILYTDCSVTAPLVKRMHLNIINTTALNVILVELINSNPAFATDWNLFSTDTDLIASMTERQNNISDTSSESAEQNGLNITQYDGHLFTSNQVPPTPTADLGWVPYTQEELDSLNYYFT